jgi:hypothetical protein
MSLKTKSEPKKPSIDASVKEEKKSVLGDLATFRAWQEAYLKAHDKRALVA